MNIQYRSIFTECQLAANAFSVNDLGLALMHTIKALVCSVKLSGNLEALKEIPPPLEHGAKVLGQSPNKMCANASLLLYQASFFAKDSSAIGVIESLFEITTLFNVDASKLTNACFDNVECDEKLELIVAELVSLNLNSILEAIGNVK